MPTDTIGRIGFQRLLSMAPPPAILNDGGAPDPPQPNITRYAARMSVAPNLMSSEDDSKDDPVLDESLEDDEGLYDIGESSLSYFGADFDVSGLVRRLKDGDIIVPRFDPDESQGSQIEGFQRQRVWTSPRMEKFIESLLLGWPVPSIFLVLEPDQRYLVLDGQQRLTAISSFYDGVYPNGKSFILDDVAQHLHGAKYETLSRESKRRINNTFIQAVVIEPKGPTGRESVYRLFGRLNSGGVSLTPQEIRVALYRGKVVNWIRTLNHDSNWRRLFGAPHLRLKDHELIVRSLALLEILQKAGSGDVNEIRRHYRPPMANVLNRYLENHRDLDSIDTKRIAEAFAASTDLLVRSLGNDALRYDGRLNAAHVDAVLAVMMFLWLEDAVPSIEHLTASLKTLRSNEEYAEFVTSSTSHRESVAGRLHLALKTLGS